MRGVRATTVRLARRVEPGEAGRTLSALVGEWAARLLGGDVPRSRVRALIVAGAVHVDGSVVRAPAHELRRGQRVEALLRTTELQPPTRRTDRPFALTAAAVLFRDRWLLAVDKPPGLPTHRGADPRRPSLVSHVEDYLRAGGARPYVAVHQRLDRDTSGVVLFAIDEAANAGLARAFAGREAHKQYLALCAAARSGPASISVHAPLSAAGPGGRVRVDEARGLAAHTEIEVLERLSGAALVAARPATGRRHQVRAHLAHVQMPILGDTVYGGPTRAGAIVAPRTLLHASRLSLPHPVTGQPLVIESPLPDDMTAALAAARRAARGR